VKLDRTKNVLGVKLPVRVYVPRRRYDALTLGYAITAFQAQGVTATRAFVLASGDDRKVKSLTAQLSCASAETRIFSARSSVREDVEAAHDAAQCKALESISSATIVETAKPAIRKAMRI
jgi:hypothetical protein